MLPAALSVLRDYALIDITDSAVIPPALPPDPARLDDESDAAWSVRLAAHAAAYAKDAERYRDAFDRACETGTWDGLLVEGVAPTVFHVRQVPMTAWDAFKRVVRQMGEDEIKTLAFRLGVYAIDNLPLFDLSGQAIKVKTAPYPGEPTFGEALTADVVNAIALAKGGRDVVHRIGLIVMKQRSAPLGN